MFSLDSTTPYSLALAADPRLAPTDYADDGIWKLYAVPGRLPELRSTFGNRAQAVTLSWHAPALSGPPRVETLYSAYLKLSFTPAAGIAGALEYLASSSHELLASLTLHNRSRNAWRGQFTALLSAFQSADAPVAAVFLGKNVRIQCSEYLALELAGDATASVQASPAAAVWLAELGPNDQYTASASVRYGHPRFFSAAQPAAQAQPERLKQALGRLHTLNTGLPQVTTGNAEWDAAIACAYAMSLRCYLGPSAHLPFPSFVFARSPEQGYSQQGDGRDHSWLWNGQVATEAYVNCPIVAACDPFLAQGVVRNYLALQQANGALEWKPGLAGQREGLESIPLLAAITRIIYDYSGDAAFVAEVWPGLLRHVRCWLSPTHDRDGDGFPEWTSSIQSAFDDCPSFVSWQPWAQGLHIQQAESPDLGAYLFRECCDLLALADELALDVPLADRMFLAHTAATLKAQVESLWSAERAIYRYRDRDSHACYAGGPILALPASAPLSDHPRRLVVRISGPPVEALTLTLRGLGVRGEPLAERFERASFGWWSQDARYCVTASSAQHFTRLDEWQASGLRSQHRLSLAWADYTREDQTLLLPLWAGIPSAERAAALVGTITDAARFWRPFGIPNCPADDPAYRSDNRGGSGGVWMMWNSMLGEGLCRYGYYPQAWELFSRIMRAIVGRLRAEQAFREAYDNDTGAGIGHRDYLWGTVPLHLLTLLSGAQILAADRVRLWHTELGGRQIVLRRLGVSVTRHGKAASIVWPDGRTQELTLEPGQPALQRSAPSP
jgi:hypothetical protein